MIKHIKINKDNLALAKKLQREIFPGYKADDIYTETANGENDFNYFLIYDGDFPIGVSGLFTVGPDPDNCWLGWFGIKPELRRKSLGSDAIRLLEETARDLGFRFMRVVIAKDTIDEGTIPFLKANGYKAEPYDNPRDKITQGTNVSILTRTFYQEPIIPWNNKNIHFTEMMEKSKL